jgi:hypothetical protein
VNGENVARLDNTLNEQYDTSVFSFQKTPGIEKIESVIALFRNFVPEKPISGVVIYFWESHSENSDDKGKINATIDLMQKEFDLPNCKNYEVRTGYLSRYNYMTKQFNKASEEEMKAAILAGEELERKWLDKCNPELPFFVKKDWRLCIGKEENCFWFKSRLD